MFVVWVAWAIAGTPVLHQGRPDLADEVAARAHVGAPEPVELAALRENAPVLFGLGEVRACASGPDDAGFVAALREVAGAVDYGDDPGLAVDRALQALACAGGAVDRAGLARLGMLAAIGAFRAGNTQAASRWFGEAKGAQPELGWDDAFDPSARDLFDASRPAGLAALRIAPSAGSRVWVDGAAVGAEAHVTVGWHAVAIETASGSVRAAVRLEGAGTSVVVLPAAGPSALAAVPDAAVRVDLGWLAAAKWGEGTPFVVAVGPGWRATAGRADWTAVGSLDSRRRAPWLGAAVTGGALGLGVGTVALVSRGAAVSAAQDMSGAVDIDEFIEAEARYGSAAGTLRWARWGPLVGVAIVGVGLGGAFLDDAAWWWAGPTGVRFGGQF